MTTWYSLELEDGAEAKKLIQRIMDAFMPKYVGSGRPLGMALFSSLDKDTKVITIYFAPKALSLAMQFGASPCGDTFIDKELALLVGDEGSIDFLFPDADKQ
jgi:hypothetical protein